MSEIQKSDNITQNETVISETEIKQIEQISKISKIKIKFAIDQSWNIYDIVTKNAPSSWENAFKNADLELRHINKILTKYEAINGISYPRRSDIFKAFEYTKLKDIKMVFVCSEPYNNTNIDGNPMATGLALSVTKNSSIPKQLYNLFNIMNKQIADFSVPKHGDLTEWAKNGILLLNVSLTVKPGESKSHSELWTGFTMKVIEEINVAKKNIPYILFGKDAAKVSQFIGGTSLIISVGNMYNMEEDLGDAFTKIRTYLTKHNLEMPNFKITE